MKIKIVRGNQDSYNEDVVLCTLKAAGSVLNGATELNEYGSYKAPHPGMSLSGDNVTLEDRWFNGHEQSMETIVQAVIGATGLRLKISDVNPNKFVGYEVVNQELYDKTAGKELQARQQELQRLNAI